MFRIMKNKCKFVWCMIWIVCQCTMSTVNCNDTGIEAPIKELCPCLPREVCPHNHAISPLDAVYLGTILKCDRPNEVRCCSISFDSSESSVTLKHDAKAIDTMQRSTFDDIELTTISNEIDMNEEESDEIIESTDASGIDTTQSNDEESTTIAPQMVRNNDDDDKEEQRREEIQRIYASKEFNGINPSYMQIVNNSPTLLVYAISKSDWDIAQNNDMDSSTILSAEQSTDLPIESSGEIDKSTENPSINVDEFVSTMQHDNSTDEHHGIKRNSIYRDNESGQVIRTPEYYEIEDDYDDGTFDKADESGDYYYSETENDMEHRAQLTAVQSLLTRMQKPLSAVQKPVNNRFDTIEQMVESSKQQFSPALGRTSQRNNYNFKPQVVTYKPTTIKTTTTTTTTTQRIETVSKRKYLQRPLPESSAKPKIRTTAAAAAAPSNERNTYSTQNFYSKNQLRTKPTKENIETESSSTSSNESMPKSVDEFRDNQSKLQTVLEKRNRLFGAKRRNILDRKMTLPQTPLVNEETTVSTATPKSKQHISSTTEFVTEKISTTRKPQRNSASRFRVRPNYDE